MDMHIRPAPVRKSISVRAAPQRAFQVFTAEMTRWWRPEHHIGKSPLRAVVVEPRVGGRWYEVGEDGTTCEWGKVLVWEPPARVVFAWQLTGEWKYDADFVTEVEVRFIPDGSGTRVEFEHRNLERYLSAADTVRGSLDSPDGWEGALRFFAMSADAAGTDQASAGSSA